MADDIEATASTPPTIPERLGATASSTRHTVWAGISAYLARLTESTSSRPHRFTTRAFVDDHVTRPLPVDYVTLVLNSWRATSLLIATFYASVAYVCFTSAFYISPIWIALVLLYGTSKVLTIIKSDFGASVANVLGYIVLAFQVIILRVISTTSRYSGGFLVWDVFWYQYFMFAFRRDHFSQNYLEAWRQKYSHQGTDHFITIFVDHSNMVRVPCRSPKDSGLKDKQLMKHLGFFYRFCRIRGGVIQALLPKSLLRVDLIELVDGHVAGNRVSTLQLGNLDHRQIRYLENPSGLEQARSIIDLLDQKKVFQQLMSADRAASETSTLPQTMLNEGTTISRGSDNVDIRGQGYSGSESANPANLPAAGGSHATTTALNFVLHWNTSLASIILLTPTLLSILICSIWPTVAVLKYDADTQMSIQTGSSLAAYIVTAGTFLVALVAWLDTIISVKETLNV